MSSVPEETCGCTEQLKPGHRFVNDARTLSYGINKIIDLTISPRQKTTPISYPVAKTLDHGCLMLDVLFS